MRLLEPPTDHGFGTENLPYGVYSIGTGPARVCTRFGDHVIDLALALDEAVFAHPTLNPFMAEGPARWASIRQRITQLMGNDVADDAVHHIDEVSLHLPIEVSDYVDFYASEHHASNLGRLFRPDNPDPLMPNWKHLPVGYHGRSASIVISGTDIARPNGQRLDPDDTQPTFGPSQRLDIEAELGFIVGVGNPMGRPIPTAEADRHLFGVVIFNDWSARDIQAWEYVPLGPNLGKSFASTVSPWVVPLAALDNARVPTPTQSPTPLPYLKMDRPWGLDIDLAVAWNGETISRPPYASMYWSPAQMLAHLTVNGAPTRPGDLFASGTVSGPAVDERGALIELTWNGAEPVDVGGRPRTFLEDGDEIAISADAFGAGGQRISFGSATGRIVAASRE